MDWKGELEFELADATEIVWCMQSALTRSEAPTPEIIALADRLKERAGVISGYVARLELQRAVANEPAQTPAASGPHQEIENAELYWTPEQLEDGRRFRRLFEQSRERYQARKQPSNAPSEPA